MKFEPDLLRAQLPKTVTEKWPDGIPFVEVFSKGNFTLEFFAPGRKDYQTPHDKDEFYIIVSGHADLVKDDEIIRCRPGDAIFVAMLERHRFENISPDFATWVVFF